MSLVQRNITKCSKWCPIKSTIIQHVSIFFLVICNQTYKMPFGTRLIMLPRSAYSHSPNSAGRPGLIRLESEPKRTEQRLRWMKSCSRLSLHTAVQPRGAEHRCTEQTRESVSLHQDHKGCLLHLLVTFHCTFSGKYLIQCNQLLKKWI